MSLERVLRVHDDRLPIEAATSLACRLCEILSGSSRPLGGLNHGDVRFMPTGEVVIASPYPYGGRRSGSLRGSFGHMSPEQLRGKPMDERSDIFNLATLLHEWIEGRRLFAGESDFAVLEAVRLAHLPPRPPAIPEALHAVLRRALASRPDDRFQTLHDFRAALLPFAGDFDAVAFAKLLDPGFAAMPPLPPEPPPRTPLTPGDEGARLVYADWLEEHGKATEARWLRQESALRSLEGAALEQPLRELRALSAQVGTEFMASVARPAVEGCPIRFGFKCPLRWDALRRTENDEVRHCAGCRQDVHFCRTLEQAQELAERGACVALDPSLVRREGDLDPTAEIGVGRLA